MKNVFHIHQFYRVMVFIALFLYAGAGVADAAKVTLTWDKPDGDVAGYRIYYGPDDGSDEMNMPGKTVKSNQTRCEISGLVQGQRYWFMMTYFNQAGVESALSEQLHYDVPVLDVNNDGIKDAAISNSSGDDVGTGDGDDGGAGGGGEESTVPDAPAEEPGNDSDFVSETDVRPSDQAPASNSAGSGNEAESGGGGGGGGGGSCFIGSLSR